MSLRTLETRIREIDKALHEVHEEIHQLKENESGSSRQVEIAQRMCAERNEMAPLGMSIKDLVEEGSER